MTIFDLLFIVAVLGNVIAVVAMLVRLARRRTDRARIWLRRTLTVDACYLVAVAVTSLVTPRHVVPVGEAQCFDDWCITVTGSGRSPGTTGDSVQVKILLSSRARGLAQGERDVAVELIDGAGKRYRPISRDGEVPLSVKLPPEGSQELSRVFVVPSGAGALSVLVVHDWFPHCCIIGDRESLLHKADVVLLGN